MQGGAARAAYRLHRALLSSEVDSQMLVQSKISDDYTVIGPQGGLQRFASIVNPVLDSLLVRFYKSKRGTLFSPSLVSFRGIARKINKLNPDIVHLHWICGGMIGIGEIAKIKAPIIWSLHDDWAFTGGCHIKWECEKFKQQCGACPHLGSTAKYDLSRIIFNKKKKIFRRLKNIVIVGLSSWLASCAKESSLLKNISIINLPNLIDAQAFSPIDKNIARDLLGLPINKGLILFGAYNATNDINKGFKLLCDALKILKMDNIELVVFGSSKPMNPQIFKFRTHYLGHLHDDVSLRLLYSSSNVLVVPSLQEAFSQTALESFSCATPVVAYGATGIVDIIDHKKNGYLAKPYEAEDLARGIEWVLSHNDYFTLCKNARNKALNCFDEKIVIQKYIRLFKEVLEKTK